MTTSLKGLIENVAPVIGTALGGPLGGAALSALSTALFGKPDEKSSAVEDALHIAEPETWAKVQIAELQFKSDALKFGLTEENIAALDVENARSREVDLAKLGKTDYTLNTLTFMLMIGFFAMFFSILLVPIPADNKEIITALIGIMASAFVGLIGYYYGSSAGSKVKDSIIAYNSKGATDAKSSAVHRQ